jgi:hypothetical protein
MGIHHGGFHIAVAEQLLNRSDVGALLQKARGELMAEGVAGCQFADPRCLHGCTHGALQKARIQMVSSLDVLPWIPPASALRKQPLPAPFPGRIPVFSLKGMEQLHSATAGSEIGLMHTPHALHVPFQELHQA